MLVRDQVERLLVHRAVGEGLVAVGPVLPPAEGVERARRRSASTRSSPFLSSRAIVLLELPTGPCRSRTRALGAVAVGGALEDVDEIHQRPLQPEDGVLAVVVGVLEELVADELLLVDDDLLGPRDSGSCRRAAGTPSGSPRGRAGRCRGSRRSCRTSASSDSPPGSGGWRSSRSDPIRWT